MKLPLCLSLLTSVVFAPGLRAQEYNYRIDYGTYFGGSQREEARAVLDLYAERNGVIYNG
jgi:hypothetical protein